MQSLKQIHASKRFGKVSNSFQVPPNFLLRPFFCEFAPFPCGFIPLKFLLDTPGTRNNGVAVWNVIPAVTEEREKKVNASLQKVN